MADMPGPSPYPPSESVDMDTHDKTRISVVIDDELLADLDALAKLSRNTRSAIVSEAVRQFVEGVRAGDD